jgi:hypothetical protein
MNEKEIEYEIETFDRNYPNIINTDIIKIVIFRGIASILTNYSELKGNYMPELKTPDFKFGWTIAKSNNIEELEISLREDLETFLMYFIQTETGLRIKSIKKTKEFRDKEYYIKKGYKIKNI